MKFVPPEPSVDLYNEGFEEPDILQQRKTGDALSDLLNRIGDPLVVALDGKWGTGKTHFLKRWAAAHEAAFKLGKPLTKLGKPLTRAVFRAVGATVVVNVADELKKARDEEAANGSDGFWQAEQGREKAMKELNEAIVALAEPVAAGHEGATVIFVIDELDRCRPVCALEVLELINHLFSVARIHFVLGGNLEALEGMVGVRYGPDIEAPRS